MLKKVKKSKGIQQDLSARQYVAISLLITGCSQSIVAKKLEVTDKTISVWMNNGLFMKVLGEQKNRILNDTVSVLVNDITQQKQLIQKAVLKNVESITSKIHNRTTPAEHKSISEALDRSLVSLELAPRFNSKVEVNNTYRGRGIQPIDPKIIKEAARVHQEMKDRDLQVEIDTEVLKLLGQPDTAPRKKISDEDYEKIMEMINT